MKIERKLRIKYPWANDNQIMEIKKGLNSNVDISEYVIPKYSASQMMLIRDGLKKI